MNLQKRHLLHSMTTAAAVLGLGLVTHASVAQAQVAPASGPGLTTYEMEGQPTLCPTLMLEPTLLTVDPTVVDAPPAGQEAGAATKQGGNGYGLLPQTGPTVAWLDAAAGGATTSAAPAGSAGNPLSLTFELPIWISGINGTAGVRGRTVPANASFSDILQATDSVIGLGGRVEADYDRWIFYLDGLYMKLTKDNIAVGPARLNFVSTLAIADAGIMYRFWDWRLGQGGQGDPTLGVAGGVGARYMHVGMNVDAARGRSRAVTQDWADPVGVGQLTLDLDKHWQILARGDIGGGGGADLTWAAGVYLGYQFEICSKVSGALKLGYQAVSEDYQSGSGNQQFTWDVIMHGPMIVLALKF